MVGNFLLLSCNIRSSCLINASFPDVIPKGDLEELNSHEDQATLQHMELVSHEVLSKGDLESGDRVLAITALDMQKQKQATDMQIMAFHSELARLREEVGVRIRRLESSLVDLQKNNAELNFTVETRAFTSYNGTYVWNIPEVARRLRDSRTGKIYSLYSVPFFTSPFGYKLCLYLYLNGVDDGKGTHHSFFVAILRGQHDALLKWPFEQLVTMILLNQDRRKNIVQVLRPEPSSSSFQQPKTEMNDQYGFTKFAPLWVLGDPSYVRNDTLYLKVIVDKTGLIQP